MRGDQRGFALLEQPSRFPVLLEAVAALDALEVELGPGDLATKQSSVLDVPIRSMPGPISGGRWPKTAALAQTAKLPKRTL